MTTQTLVRAISLEKITAIKLPRINVKLFLTFGFCSILALAVFYVYQISTMMQGSFAINNYKGVLTDLVKQNKNLEVNLAQISYLDNVKADAQALNFKQVKTIKYIQVASDYSLARY